MELLGNDFSAKTLSPTGKTFPHGAGWVRTLSLYIIVTEKVQTLLTLRQHGTDPNNADPIYSDKVLDSKKKKVDVALLIP